MHDFALLRAAELTLDNGFTHFKVIGAADASTTGTYSTPSTSHTTAMATSMGPTTVMQANTVYSGGQTQNVHKPGIDLMVKCYKGIPPGDAFDAAFLQQSLKAKYNL